jgi:DNA-directed RNA polymerase specialized sigma24 family protein
VHHARRETLRHAYQALIGQYAHCNPPSPPDELCSREHQRLQVWQALQRLRIYDRELVVLRYLEELLYDEIASILKVSRKFEAYRQTVKNFPFYNQAYQFFDTTWLEK